MTKGLEVFTVAPESILWNEEKAKQVINAKLDPRWIKQRVQGKATLSYIGGQTVIRLLNKAFDYQWSFEIISEDVVQSIPKVNKWAKEGQPKEEAQPPVAKVLGRLTVPGLGVKEQYGSKVLIGGATEQESAFKAAATDALKKCASLFGIGLELYGEDEGMDDEFVEEKAPTVTKKPEPKPEPQQDAPPAQQAPREEPAKQETGKQQTSTAASASWAPEDINRLKEMKAILGITENSQLDVYVKKFFDNDEVTWRNITPQNIKAVNIFLAKEAESN